MAVRLKDIAERTGVTVSSVSKALNHSPEISEETARFIRETAMEMGYVIRPVHKKKSHVIGVMVPEVRSHYYAELLHAIGNELEEREYVMLTMMTFYRASNDRTILEQICRYKLDGLIVSCYHPMPKSFYSVLTSSGIPTVLLAEGKVPIVIDRISIDQEVGVEMALEHLLGLGHRKIGYLGEFNSDSRFQWMCDYMRQREIPLDLRFVKRGRERFEKGGYLRALELLEEEELPTAVIASYDQVAYGAMRAFREKDVRVPEDISIIGFDNIVMDEYHSVPLTSITNPVEQMGTVAVKILLDNINHPHAHVIQNVMLQNRLVIRSSTCPLGGTTNKKKGTGNKYG